jgi:hypothetical protein
MGGFVSADGRHPIVTEEQLRLRPEYLAAIQSIRVEDIEDKSKGDSLSKGLAVQVARLQLQLQLQLD